MESKSKYYLIKGKELERYFDFNIALHEFHDLFNQQLKDERAIVILGGAFIEMTLEHLLYAFLPEDDVEVKKLFEYNQPLGSFSNKISIAYCLGLIDKVIKDDLNYIRKIRNKFAHDLYADFKDTQIKSWNRNLNFYKISMMSEPPIDATELDIFQAGVNQLISHLGGNIDISRGEKRKILNNLGNFLKL